MASQRESTKADAEEAKARTAVEEDAANGGAKEPDRPAEAAELARRGRDDYDDDYDDDGYEDERYRVRRRRARYRDDDIDDGRIGYRIADEWVSLSRALTAGYLSQLEFLADVTGSVAGGVLDRRRADDRMRSRELRSRRGRRGTARDELDDESERFEDEPPRRARALRDDDLDDIPSEARTRRVGSRRRSPRGRAPGPRAMDEWRDASEDVYDGVLDALEDALEAPRRAIDEFYDTYRRSSARSRR
jgi:hypothetical protein